MYRFGVAYPDGFYNEKTINHMHEFPQVRECSIREAEIKIAGLRHEVDWQYITEHEIK